MDVHTPEQRRKNMQAIKASGTKIEKVFAKVLWAKGYRYRKNYNKIIGKPDFVFVKYKIVIFCDGDYWHGKDWETAKSRIKTNTDFWQKKIEGNIKRDKEVNKVLQEQGWTVLRFWESEIKKELNRCIDKVESSIEEMIMKKYSEVRKELNFKIEKNSDEGLAYLTHYFQNNSNGVSHHYKQAAVDFYNSEKVNSLKVAEPELQTYLPFDWDIPFPPPQKPEFTFIDLFAGIGGFRLAFQKMNGKCVFSSEYNHFAKKTYEANFGEVPFGDITKIDEKEIPAHDVLLAGFPCQPFSIAGVSKKNSLGKKHGFLDETQGNLFFDIARILIEKRPKMFLLENVKNLVSHDKGRTFKVISETLRELNYTIYYKVLDGKYFVPQHRERIFIVGFNNELCAGREEFSFPKMPEQATKIKDILQKDVDAKYTLSEHLWTYLQNYAAKHKSKGNGFGFGLTNLDTISRTLSARYYKDGSEVLIPQKGKNPRRLTPRECARLQGFPDDFIIPVSDTQSYKQFGNAVVMPLVHFIAKEMIKNSKCNE